MDLIELAQLRPGIIEDEYHAERWRRALDYGAEHAKAALIMTVLDVGDANPRVADFYRALRRVAGRSYHQRRADAGRAGLEDAVDALNASVCAGCR